MMGPHTAGTLHDILTVLAERVAMEAHRPASTCRVRTVSRQHVNTAIALLFPRSGEAILQAGVDAVARVDRSRTQATA